MRGASIRPDAQPFPAGAPKPQAPAPAPPPRGPPSRPRRRSGRSLQGEARLVLHVLDPDAVRARHEHAPRVGGVDLLVLESALTGVVYVLLVRVDEQRQMIQKRPLADAVLATLHEVDRLVARDDRLRAIAFLEAEL